MLVAYWTADHDALTASALAISISSVKARLHRARIMLEKELAPKLKLTSPKKRRWLPWY
jgi:RNA polymerase sigma-70 factor (ECF subfamily)